MGVAPECVQPEAPSLRAGLGSKRRDDHDGGAVGDLQERLGQLAGLRRRPVHVLERDHDRLVRREGLDPVAERPPDRRRRRLVRRFRLRVRVEVDAQQAAERREHVAQAGAEQGTEARPCTRACRDLRLRLADREPPAEHLLERPRGKTAVGEALPFEPRGALARRSSEAPRAGASCRCPRRRREARPAPCRRRDPPPTPGGGPARLYGPRAAPSAGRPLARKQRPGELTCGHGPLAAAHGELAERLEAEAMREAAGGLLAHGDRAGSRDGLQSRCDVGRVSERDGLVIHGAHDADRGRAGVDADADVESLDPPRLLDLARVLPHDVHDPQRRAGGPLGVVLVSGRNAEVRADAVAHVRLHRPAVLVHGAAHLVHAFADQRLRLLRRQLLGERGRPDDVGEEHRHGANLVVTRHAQRPRVRQVPNDPSRPCMRSSLDGPFRMRHAGAGRRRLAAPSGPREHERGYAHRRGAGRVPGRVPARPRRHERRLSRRAREPRPQGRPQGAGVAAGARPELPRAVHAGVAARGRARPPERHPDLRRGRGRRRRRRRSALHRDAVRRRARPALAPASGRGAWASVARSTCSSRSRAHSTPPTTTT